MALFILLVSTTFSMAQSINLQSSQTLSSSHSIVMDYMVELKDNLTDSNGQPRLSTVSDPTEAWALQDIGKETSWV